MAVMDRLRDLVSNDDETPTFPPLDAKTKNRISNGRRNQKKWKAQWAECLAFVQSRQFVYRDASNKAVLNELETLDGGVKPKYRARQARNRILGYVLGEISAGTQRVPQYDVTPTSPDPDVINAAAVAERVLDFLYDFLKLRKELINGYYYAVICGEGFLRPYWNSQAGKQLPPDPETGEVMYEGDVAVDVYGPHEVFWEPGVDFQKSDWHAIETAKTLHEIRTLPGFIGGELRPDVRGDDSIVSGALTKGAVKADMVLLTEYLEKPCSDRPQGRRLFIANNMVICPEEPYPVELRGPNGYEPCLHRLSYIPTPDRDRDMGLVEHLLDAQRTVNDATNKQVELKNLALNLPLLVGPNGLKKEYVLEPGAVIQPKGGVQDAKWMTPPDSGYMTALSRMRDEGIADMEEIASQRSVPAQIESGKGLATFTERDNMRRQFILAMFVDFHSGVGKHLLCLVQQGYTEPRTLQIAGRDRLDYLFDFKGADLQGQTSVRVLPASIEARTRESINQTVMNYAQLGWIDPQRAMAAIEAGTAEGLLDDARKDEARQQREIQSMIGLRDDVPSQGRVPIAKSYDNHDVHLGVLHNWMKSKDFEQQPPEVQECAELHEEQHRELQMQDAARQQEIQNLQAQQQGAMNAARPAQSPMPSLPAATPS
jgi:hypothetical protein